ncbi:MAG: TATA box-binding protein, partial [Nitrososphaeria archaeon]|nr:TATA box-binding protein [Nitrososphaeria archaeon]NIN51810.1 TATA box-binding protein [Nitrososphaeria archaeon]NIQ32343.1 TATA box-binding protein [Nitrososphaeria archaeon]
MVAEPAVKIENIVASVTIDQRVDLRKVLEKFPHT